MLDLDPEQVRLVRAVLDQQIPGVPVWAFGSRVRGTAGPFSDLDLVLITDQPLAPSTRAALAEAFSDSALPFRVDLVDWAATGEAFRAVIQRQYEVFPSTP